MAALQKSPGGAGSVAPLGLGPEGDGNPRLTPWAIVFRPSGPEAGALGSDEGYPHPRRSRRLGVKKLPCLARLRVGSTETREWVWNRSRQHFAAFAASREANHGSEGTAREDAKTRRRKAGGNESGLSSLRPGVQREFFLQWGKPVVALQKYSGRSGFCRPAGAGSRGGREPTAHAVGRPSGPTAKPYPCSWMTENDSRRDAETRRERAFHSPSSSHQAVSPFSSQRLCASARDRYCMDTAKEDVGRCGRGCWRGWSRRRGGVPPGVGEERVRWRVRPS